MSSAVMLACLALLYCRVKLPIISSAFCVAFSMVVILAASSEAGDGPGQALQADVSGSSEVCGFPRAPGRITWFVQATVSAAKRASGYAQSFGGVKGGPAGHRTRGLAELRGAVSGVGACVEHSLAVAVGDEGMTNGLRGSVSRLAGSRS